MTPYSVTYLVMTCHLPVQVIHLLSYQMELCTFGLLNTEKLWMYPVNIFVSNIVNSDFYPDPSSIVDHSQLYWFIITFVV